ncbi:MAG: phage tail sheath C-terminal domain-containing protein [Planctomycetota bacterium]
MSGYDAPGVHIAEDLSDDPSAPACTPCLFGRAARGPVGEPTRIESPADFDRVFGAAAGSTGSTGSTGSSGTGDAAGTERSPGFLADAVRGFFANQGRACYVCRVGDDPATRPAPEAYERALDGFADAAVAPEVELLAFPDAFERDPSAPRDAARTIFAAALRHAESTARLAVLDAPPQDPATTPAELARRADDLAAFAGELQSSHAALYAPWLEVEAGAAKRLVPPSGHVLGCYARTEEADGLGGVPGNVQLHGTTGPALSFEPDAQPKLAPAGVNYAVRDALLGTRLWGARTTSPDDPWRFVPPRRVVNRVQRGLRSQLSWLATESNDESTWNRATEAARDFLRPLWKQGALYGSEERDAFLVHCGLGATMSPDDVAAGRLRLAVQLAASRPGELVELSFEWGLGGASG